MGLDMYLSAKKYHSSAEWLGDGAKKEFTKLKRASGVVHEPFVNCILFTPVADADFEVNVWQLYFVKNCANTRGSLKFGKLLFRIVPTPLSR